MQRKKQGFTLIELLIVIAIIAIIAAIVYVALDPLTRFRDARDSRRWADISSMLTAIKVNQVDNRGTYLASIDALATSTNYMISGNGAITGCAPTCDVTVASSSDCVDLSGLVTAGYLGSVAVSPDGTGTWTTSTTGYVLSKGSNGIITITACESENTSAISLVR
jgi:prepilin-type N-terminal cleavage/methylation domain-containing protein